MVFLNLEDNDNLSQIGYNDIIEMLKEYKLSLRDNLNLNSNVTFGLEIEFENIKTSYDEMFNLFSKLSLLPSTFFNNENVEKLKNYKKHSKTFEIINQNNYSNILPEEVFFWNFDKDISLDNGGEITSPILIDKKEYWYDLKKVCDFIKKYAKLSIHSSGHIHIGSNILGKDKTSWINFLNLWSSYENVIFRFGFNEYLNINSRIRYCEIMSEKFKKVCKSLAEDYDLEIILHFLKDNRLNAVNFQNVTLTNKVIPFSTIEFRNPNGCLNPIIWQNNVNFFTRLLMYCSRSDFDMDKVLKRKKEEIYFNNYHKAFFEQAVELADMIFDNNLDKINFLKQYVKDNTNSLVPMRKAKKFTM